MENREKNELFKRIEETFSKREPGDIGNYKHFSVLMPLVILNDEPHVLFEVRGNKIKRQPGEICFPGGMCEENETYIEAAIRETCEELGIERDSIRMINELDRMVNVRGFTIHCYLAQLPEQIFEIMKPNEIEVQEIFTVPVKWFMENEPHVEKVGIETVIKDDFPYDMLNLDSGYKWGKGEMDVPIYNEYDGKIIWGITGRILRNFINILKV